MDRAFAARLAHTQSRCGLVEDHDVRGEGGCTADGNRLPLPTRHQADGGVEVGQVNLQPLEHLSRRRGHLLAPDHPQRARQPAGPRDLAARVEVVGRAEVVEERQILVHGLHPERARVGRGVDRDRSAVHLDRAAVEPVHAAEALDQRRLAGPVVSQERQHLAVTDLERDAVERGHGSEPLAGSVEPEGRNILRATRDGKLGDGRHACLTACATWTRPSM